MRAYGPAHLSWLCSIAAVSVVLSIVCRRQKIPKTSVRLALVALLVGGEVQRYFKDGMAFPDRVPLHPCNVTAWVAVIACLTLSQSACEFTYFCGLAGAGMALVTPDMGAEWPPRFFVNHGALILTSVVLAGGRIMPVRRGAPWRAFGLFAAYALLVGIFNWQFGTNYAYLAHKPDSATLIDFLGPWPVYILSEGALAIGLFWLFWLPLRPNRAAAGPARAEPSFMTKYFHGPAMQEPVGGRPSGRDGD